MLTTYTALDLSKVYIGLSIAVSLSSNIDAMETLLYERLQISPIEPKRYLAEQVIYN